MDVEWFSKINFIGVLLHETCLYSFSARDLRRKNISECWLRRLPRSCQMAFQIVGIYMPLLEPAKTLHLLESCRKCSVGWIRWEVNNALQQGPNPWQWSYRLVFVNSSCWFNLWSSAQVKLMKRIAEMPDIKPILRKLPRIKKYLLNSDNIRWAKKKRGIWLTRGHGLWLCFSQCTSWCTGILGKVCGKTTEMWI